MHAYVGVSVIYLGKMSKLINFFEKLVNNLVNTPGED